MIRIIRKKSFIQKLNGDMNNFKLFAFLGVLTLVIGLTFYLTTQKQDIRQNASFTPLNTLDPGFTSLIVLAANQNELSKYQALSGPSKSISYRTVKFDPQQEIDLFEQNRWAYFLTVASSDFIAHQNSQNLYNYNITQLDTIAQKPGFRGFYFHELMTYRALTSGWDWNVARDTVDWGWIKQIVDIAKKYNKKVIWSEPTYAWKTIYESPPVMDLFAQWGSTIVPMYATNFTQTEINSSKEFAAKVAQKYTLVLGQSHQGWYWQNTSQGTDPTREGSYNLALDGWNSGARYFQFEGNVGDFLWDSAYMLGVRDFTNYLSTQYSTPTSNSTPTIIPQATPTPTQMPRPTSSSTQGIVDVSLIPSSIPASIRIIDSKTGKLITEQSNKISSYNLVNGNYYVSFSYSGSFYNGSRLRKPPMKSFVINDRTKVKIIGDFNSGKTTVTYSVIVPL